MTNVNAKIIEIGNLFMCTNVVMYCTIETKSKSEIELLVVLFLISYCKGITFKYMKSK